MDSVFDIQPGRYDVPSIGSVDAFEPVSEERLLRIYRLRRGVFPWITPNGRTLGFLKKQKLLVADIAKMMQNAQTVQEVEMLLELSESKTIKRIADIKLAGFEKQN